VLGNMNIIVDSGVRASAAKLERIITNIEEVGEGIDLFIVTHTDKDHIGGLKRLIDEKRFKFALLKEVWINDGEFSTVHEDSLLTAQDGRNIIDIFREKGVNVITEITTDHCKEFGVALIRVLSPTKDDLELMKKEWKNDINIDNLSPSSDKDNGKDLDDIIEDDKFANDANEYNNASITFQLSTKNAKGLFLADASSRTVLNGLNESEYIEKGEVDFIKVPHHGSKANTSKELIKTFKTQNYILSTNGSRGKPHKLTLARILSESDRVNLFCNYCWWTDQNKFTLNDHEKYIKTGILNRIALTTEFEEIKQGVVIKND